MKSLVAYFSRADENYVAGAIKPLNKGNTEIVAEILAKETDSDLFKIKPVREYPKHYNDCTKEALGDLRRNARPEFEKPSFCLCEYERIYLGFPHYWGTAPMVVLSFLERYDWAGKEIIVFMTHEGSGFGHALEDVRKSAPNAIVKEGFAIPGYHVDQAEDVIENYLKKEE